jgi:phosphoglycerate kinase
VKSLDDLDVTGRRVLVRSDLNTPLETADDGSVRLGDDGRIRAALPTIQELVGRGARVVIAAHLGRPKGEVRPELSLAPVAQRLGELLGSPVVLATDVAGESARSVASELSDGQVAVVENVRFEAAETSKDDAVRGAFADRLASLADLYVDDAFGAVHRKHASVYDVALRLPHAAGRLVETEVAVLNRLTRDPERPYAVALGGSKVSDKLAVIENLLRTVDRLLVGGGMVYTFLAAQGHAVGTSLLETDQIDTVRGFLRDAEARGVEVVLPVDILAAERFAADAEPLVVPADQIPADRMGLDIGPQSAALFAARLTDARTVFWNGPMGVFEFPAYAAGTRALAGALADVSTAGGLTVVGGGDSAAAVRALGFADTDFGHISTGGGASLEYLEGKVLPGLAVLED